MQTSPDGPGVLVKRYREQSLQLSQGDLAWLADVSRGTVSNLETGKVTPDERTWHRIRTAIALDEISLEDLRTGQQAHPLFTTDAIQGIIVAILRIRNRDPDHGRRTAGRWRQLIAMLGVESAGPEVRAELDWLAHEVAVAAPPEAHLPIYRALRNWGWDSQEYQPERAVVIQAAPTPVSQMSELVSRLDRTINNMASELQVLRDQAQGFERLPIRVQDLLARARVVDYESLSLDGAEGCTIINLVVADEKENLVDSRSEILDATRRWNHILRLARYIFENLAPGRNPAEIMAAVERGLRLQGSADRSEDLRREARGGHPGSMYDLGKLLKEFGRIDEAESWLRRAAEADHPGAMFHLGRLHHETGRTEEAEHWLRRAAEARHPNATFHLGRLLQRGGRLDEAEPWLRRAAEAGHPSALFHLGNLLQETHRSDEAEIWLRRAAEAGHSGALNRFELALYEQQQLTSVETAGQTRHPGT